MKIERYDDYVQSANTLFHFMKEPDYLVESLLKKAFVPRYCKEEIDYLNLSCNNVNFSTIAVLQKCFCDIPFHKLNEAFEVKLVGESDLVLTPQERTRLMMTNTHPELYGKYAIGLSKEWGERKGLQPVHYLSKESNYVKKICDLFLNMMHCDELPDEVVDDILYRLSYIKPLRGKMVRVFEKDDSQEKISITLMKNFHDEREWRYIPSVSDLENVIANPNVICCLQDINESLNNPKFSTSWLEYQYSDIRYIIVPNVYERIELIKKIMELPNENFCGAEIQMEKYILISKIVVLDELRKDW